MKEDMNVKKERIIKELKIPDGVNATTNGQFLIIKGPKGEVKRSIKKYNVLVKINNNKIVFESKSGRKKDKKMMGSLTAHASNMIKGILHNHAYVLKICSGHFPMNVSISGNKLTVKNFLGEKVPRIMEIREGAEVKVEGDLIHVCSASKEVSGQVSADIEQLTRRTGFDSRVFQDGCYIIVKDGKELK